MTDLFIFNGNTSAHSYSANREDPVMEKEYNEAND